MINLFLKDKRRNTAANKQEYERHAVPGDYSRLNYITCVAMGFPAVSCRYKIYLPHSISSGLIISLNYSCFSTKHRIRNVEYWYVT
ncbi:MAG: hypothetical protein ACOYN4_16530 [Bacteroidales bacterium]